MTAPALFDLSDYGLLKVNGPDAKNLLQGQLTCDVENITSAQNCIGAHCNSQGRIMSLFRLFKIDENYYLHMPRDLVPIALSALKKYAVFFRVELMDASADLFCFGTTLMPQIKNVYAFHIQSSLKSRYLIVGESKTKEAAWDVLAKKAQIMMFGAWKEFDINDGFPLIYPNTSGKILPHEINLHEIGAISFSKGCYTGQEIIARMHYRGKLKKRMVHAQIINAYPPQPGAEIYCAATTDVVGMVVDSCQEKDDNYKALILLDEVHIKDKYLALDPKSTVTFTILREKQ